MESWSFSFVIVLLEQVKGLSLFAVQGKPI
jgi:hypothetical protein